MTVFYFLLSVLLLIRYTRSVLDNDFTPEEKKNQLDKINDAIESHPYEVKKATLLTTLLMFVINFSILLPFLAISYFTMPSNYAWVPFLLLLIEIAYFSSNANYLINTMRLKPVNKYPGPNKLFYCFGLIIVSLTIGIQLAS